jgi:acyl carrier protein
VKPTEDKVISEQRALELMQDSLTGLRRAGMIDREVKVEGDTPLLGTGSQLDSMAFVTFVSDLEDRIGRETGDEVFIVLDEVHDFNADNPYLAAATLAGYIQRLTSGAGAADA